MHDAVSIGACCHLGVHVGARKHSGPVLVHLWPRSAPGERHGRRRRIFRVLRGRCGGETFGAEESRLAAMQRQVELEQVGVSWDSMGASA